MLVGAYPPGADLSWNGSAYDDDDDFFVFQEGRVVLDAAWEVPGSSPTMTLAAGEAVCAYYVHYSPATGVDEKPTEFKIEFGVPIVGVVRTDAGLSQTDVWMGGQAPPTAPAYYDDGQRGLESNEEIEIKNADGVDDSKLELDKVEESFDSSDDIRIFTHC